MLSQKSYFTSEWVIKIEVIKKHVWFVLSQKILNCTKLRDWELRGLLLRWDIDVINMNWFSVSLKSERADVRWRKENRLFWLWNWLLYQKDYSLIVFLICKNKKRLCQTVWWFRRVKKIRFLNSNNVNSLCTEISKKRRHNLQWDMCVVLSNE